MNRPSRSVPQPLRDPSTFPWDELEKLREEKHLVTLAKTLLVLQDRWAAVLKPPEYRAVELILRQTLGFRKELDRISIDQFANGISGRAGIGVTRSKVHVALAPLLDCGLVVKNSYQKGAIHKYRVDLEVLFRATPVQHLDRRAGESAALRRSPASETTSVPTETFPVTSEPESSTVRETNPEICISRETSPVEGTGYPAEGITLAPEVPPVGLGSPVEGVIIHSLKPLKPLSAPAAPDGTICPTCRTSSWRMLESGERICGLCQCERAGFPNLRPQVDQFLRGLAKAAASNSSL